MPDALSTYRAELEAAWRTGAATEHTHRIALQRLLEALDPGIRVINEPRRVACGAPDFLISLGEAPIGHIEAKDFGAPLEELAESEQILRYREALPNLILTDYLEFRWFVGGEPRLQARLAQSEAGRLRPLAGGADEVRQLLRAFLNAPGFTIAGPEELARRLAGSAQLSRQAIAAALEHEPQSGALHQQIEAFRKVLLHDLSKAQFADMFAQTLCYGLFSARSMHRGAEPFSRRTAPFDLPATNPFLRWLFAQIAGPDLDERIAWTVDATADLLRRVDLESVLAGFGRGEAKPGLPAIKDPVFHFYETFLAAYDPALRARRGVFYTPQPVVHYIVTCVDDLLRRHFRLRDGLADTATLAARGKQRPGHRVLILDPAAGTGAFLYEVVDQIHSRFRGNEGVWSSYVAEHLLPRLFGFELLMAPYAVAHFKLALQLEATGYRFAARERLGVYLTNTLEEPHLTAGLPMFAHQLADEANAASEVKRDRPVMVILGNPPYSGHSANNGAWISGLLRGTDIFTQRPTHNYFAVDGQPLGERNPKWLNDDYVKFLRFAQWRIEQTGYGIMAFITNNGYLENPTFRGMRQALLDTFNDVFVVNLHGDSKKKEQAPDGGKDENVFDIQQGVAIGMFVKSKRSGPPAVHYCDVWGTRESGKFDWLATHDLHSTPWREVKPRAPLYLFTPQASYRRQAEYERGWGLNDAMPLNVLGFQTHRDPFAVAFRREEIVERVSALRCQSLTDERLRQHFDLRDTRDWQLARARQQVRAMQEPEAPILQCWYRPLDQRWCYYSPISMDFPRSILLQHVAGRPNLCLNTVRQTRMGQWRHALVSDAPAPAVYVELKDGSNLFPLYLYDGSGNGHLFRDGHEIAGVNFADEFTAAVSQATGLRYLGAEPAKVRGFTAEQLFAYIYAVLHAPSFAERYGDYLRRGWPRVPLTTNSRLFRRLSDFGEELIACHLLRCVEAGASFPVPGNNRVDFVAFDAMHRRVSINDQQHFAGVEEEVWGAALGGYCPASQWLKDRIGTALDFESLEHYRRLIGALRAGLHITERIESSIPGWPLP
ncbi:MAG: type ISP restriction/modification enzyme [Terriglobales bacterium]